MPDIAQPGAPQQRIADRVQQHVPVRVRTKAPVEGNPAAADAEMVARLEGMHVEAVADANVRVSHPAPPAAGGVPA